MEQEPNASPAPGEKDPSGFLTPEKMAAIESLEAAKVALGWTMERLQKLEEANVSLKDQMAATQTAQEAESQRTHALRQTLEERGKHLDEERLFYDKLSGTLKLLCEGKVDLSALIQKQMELEMLQKRLSEEHQKRLLDLEQNQRYIADRWHERLLALESTYAQRLNYSRESFDKLRQDQESADHKRLEDKERVFQEREMQMEKERKELREAHEQKSRQAEERATRQNAQLEADYETFKTNLYQQLAGEREAIENAYEKRLGAMEATLAVERHRFEEENRKKEAEKAGWERKTAELSENFIQLKAAREKEISERLAAQETHYRKEWADLRERSQAAETRGRALEGQYIARQAQLETGYQKLTKELQNASMRREEELKYREASLREDLEREKRLLTQELSAAIETSKALSRQICGLKENALQEAMQQDANWSKTVEELKAEVAQLQGVRMKEAEEHHKAMQNLQKEARSNEALWKAQFQTQENEWIERERLAREEHRKKTGELETHFTQQTQSLQAQRQALKNRLEQDLESQRKTFEPEITALKKEREMLLEMAAQVRGQSQKEMLEKLAAYDGDYKARVSDIETREREHAAQLRAKEKELAEQKDKWYMESEERRREMDELEHVLMKRLADFELVEREKDRQWRAREEVFRQRDQEWHRHRKDLESSYAQKSGQLERLREELSQEITNYKNKEMNGGIAHG